MSPVIIAYILSALQLIPSLLGDVASVNAIIADVKAVLSAGQDPTADQWAALNAKMAAALAALQAAQPAA